MRTPVQMNKTCIYAQMRGRISEASLKKEGKRSG
ncbi:hypothetical protein Poly41_15990 [Novipirellula artificiosorum]|uniref:Uncharacterized protein n=1 Tax=Novipirellula artificiosorum TaxID=2528016 RepID=A0A5C6DX26_9BACT|nr:hypothetical protein Poly41_15990 [Novipirellula artificiosorum]